MHTWSTTTWRWIKIRIPFQSRFWIHHFRQTRNMDVRVLSSSLIFRSMTRQPHLYLEMARRTFPISFGWKPAKEPCIFTWRLFRSVIIFCCTATTLIIMTERCQWSPKTQKNWFGINTFCTRNISALTQEMDEAVQWSPCWWKTLRSGPHYGCWLFWSYCMCCRRCVANNA